MDIDQLSLTVRSHKRLQAEGIDTVEKLISISWKELQAIKGLGEYSISEIVWACVHEVMHGDALKALKEWEERYPPRFIEEARRFREIKQIVSKE